MRLGEAWRVALGALRANRLRSGLTMLGVIIGVAAVVILVAIGTGTKQKVEQQVEGLGSNLLIVVPGRVEFGAAPAVSRLGMSDVDAVTRIVGDRTRVAARSSGRKRTYRPPPAANRRPTNALQVTDRCTNCGLTPRDNAW